MSEQRVIIEERRRFLEERDRWVAERRRLIEAWAEARAALAEAEKRCIRLSRGEQAALVEVENQRNRAERAEARVAELEAAVPLTAEQAKDPELISRVAAVIRDGPWIDRDTPGEMARDVLASLSPTGGERDR